MKETRYLCDLCGEQLKIARFSGGWEYNTAMEIHLKYDCDIDYISKKQKIHICPKCLREIRERMRKTEDGNNG
jgi:hypothetical protein